MGTLFSSVHYCEYHNCEYHYFDSYHVSISPLLSTTPSLCDGLVPSSIVYFLFFVFSPTIVDIILADVLRLLDSAPPSLGIMDLCNV